MITFHSYSFVDRRSVRYDAVNYYQIWWKNKNYISSVDKIVSPMANACCFPSAIIAWEKF